jgi:hypothetical protein
MSVSDRTRIARAVLSYLAKNPSARDTLEGIVEWWLPEQRIKHDISEVKEVLADLTAKDLILAYETGDTRVHYRINREKEKEIRALLKDPH